jgi:tRNA(fMet)-specific endonuclease VapC
MMQYMLDTNICIYVIKNYPPELRERFNTLAEQLCMSSITLAELYCGAEKSTRRFENLQAIEQFRARLEVLAFSEKAAAHFGQIRADSERLGAPVGPLDMLIGAHARAEGLTVVTNNERKFRRLPGVQVENWVDGGGSPA